MARKKKTKAQIEYERERKRLQARVRYARKKGYETVEVPELVKRGSKASEYKKATTQIKKAQREQAKFTKGKIYHVESEAPEKEDIPNFYEMYCDLFVEQLNRIPLYENTNCRGRDHIIGWFNAERSKGGSKRVAELIANAERAGMVLGDPLYYEPIAHAWTTDAMQYLGIEIAPEEMEQMQYVDASDFYTAMGIEER